MNLRRFGIALAVVAAGAVAVVRPAAPTHEPGGPLLPDLKTATPRDFKIATTSRGERRLHFTNEVVNAHTGPLELFPVSEDCDGDGQRKNDRSAYQRIYRDANGDGYFSRGIDTSSTVVKRGCFVNHPRHHHWHFEDFARYELVDYSSGNRGAVVAGSVKVTFCMVDTRKVAALPGTPSSAYYVSCDRASTQGISVGWSDVYSASLVDQYVDITGVPSGTYCFVSTADPVNRLYESDDSNNGAAARITLSGTTITASLSEGC